MQLSDVEACAKLIAAFAQTADARTPRSCGDAADARRRAHRPRTRRRGAGLAARAVLRPRLRLRADAGHRVHGRRPDVRAASGRGLLDPRARVVGVERLRVADEHGRPRARRSPRIVMFARDGGACLVVALAMPGRVRRRRRAVGAARTSRCACCTSRCSGSPRAGDAALRAQRRAGSSSRRSPGAGLIILGVGWRSRGRRATCCGSPRSCSTTGSSSPRRRRGLARARRALRRALRARSSSSRSASRSSRSASARRTSSSTSASSSPPARSTMTIVCTLWWAYFDVVRARRRAALPRGASASSSCGSRATRTRCCTCR